MARAELPTCACRRGCERARHCARVEIVSPRGLRKVRVKHRRSIRAHECAEAGPERRHTVGPRRFELSNVHDDGVAGGRAFYVERTCLRIVMAGGHHLRRKISSRLHSSVETVFCPTHDAGLWLDPLAWSDAAECVHEIGVLRRPLEQRRISGNVREERPRRGRRGLLSADTLVASENGSRRGRAEWCTDQE
jgi:hypothetical protein